MNGEGNQDNPGSRNSGVGKLMSFVAGANFLATIVYRCVRRGNNDLLTNIG